MSVLTKIFSAVSRQPEQVLKNEALRKAAVGGRLDRVQKLLDDGAGADYRDVNNLTPLYFAASNGFNDICRLLLERGADPDAGKAGNLEGTALTQAASQGYFDVVKTLIEFKADPDTIGYERRTALHEAIWKGHADMAKFLLEAGA